MLRRVCHLSAVPFLLCLFTQLPGATARPLSAQEQGATVVFLVRHAERADDTRPDARMAMDPRMTKDPPLSAAGRERAVLLAGMLRDAGLTRIHSTDYLRTRETARPTSQSTGIETTLYEATELDALARKLRATPGRHLVVGHSNTTYDLVRALGGDPGSPIEALEYDRLYLITLDESRTTTVLLRFGAAFEPSLP